VRDGVGKEARTQRIRKPYVAFTKDQETQNTKDIKDEETEKQN
jgi:hypothetical protein